MGDHRNGWIVPRKEVLSDLQTDPNRIRQLLDNINSKSQSLKYEMIPCGKCWACRLNYSAEWATRIMLESKKNDHNYFITLTYDDEHVPKNKHGFQVLVPNDTSAFIKSLRKPFERKGIKGIKYFLAGEYGPTTRRPHYHMILMHCPLDINQFYDTHIDSQFKEHWKSPEIEKHWGKGMVDICAAEWSTAAYVARYCTKKIFDNTEEYKKRDMQPEFVRMSKGIGMDYFYENAESIYDTDEVVMKTIRGNTGSYKPPKAFDRKFKEQNEERWKEVQRNRLKASNRSRKLKQAASDVTDAQRLDQEREKILMKAKMLPREGNETIGSTA